MTATFHCQWCGREWQADRPVHFHRCLSTNDEQGAPARRQRWAGDRELTKVLEALLAAVPPERLLRRVDEDER